MDLKLIILDRLRNIVTTTDEVEKMLLAKAKGMASKCVSDRYSVQAARTILRDGLTKWLSDNGFTGHRSTKLVGKAMSRALDKYELRIRAALMDDIKTAKREGHHCRARYLAKEMADGQIGKNLGYFK